MPVIGLAVWLLAACNMPRNTPVAESPAGLIHTIAAQTAIAEQTRVAAGLPPQSGVTLPPPLPTLPTFTAQPTTPALPTATPQPPPPTQIPCDLLSFGDPIDVTVPDGTEMQPGEVFVKTWRLKNAGSCTWTTAYALVFVSGESMGALSSIPLSTTVAPGETIDVSVSLTAPLEPGTYRGYFKLRNANGVLFGWGPESKAFWVEIVVPEKHGVMFDFIAAADEAEWGSGTTPVAFDTVGTTDLNYGGPDGNADGFVMVKDEQKLEDGKKSGKILETYPKMADDGYIIGRYPVYRVGAGDEIRARIGFIANPDGTCGGGNAIFAIYYTLGTDVGTLTKLGEWEETCDGRLTKITLSLASLAGKDVQFYLLVKANGPATDDTAVWDSLGVMR
ncbi:MAG: hypothetical protein D6803_00390 [Anaerolineae bacterium]|nr:MAG: hypothetical protein D6803_00390 [Anaerolineae bacterium]